MANTRNVFLDLPDATPEEMGRFMSTVTGFNTGAQRFAHGVLQGAEKGLDKNFKDPSQAFSKVFNINSPSIKSVSDSLQRFDDQHRVGNLAKAREEEFQKAYASHPDYATGGLVAGGIAGASPLMAIPGVGQSAMMRAVTSGLTQGALTGGGQYVNEGESRLENTVIGALTGGVFGGLGHSAVNAGIKAGNAWRGNYADPAEMAIVQLGQQHNVPVFASDASKNSLIKGTGRALEEVPFIGLTGDRHAQMVAAKEAAEGVGNQFRSQMDQTPFGGKTGMKAISDAATAGGARGSSAKEVLEQTQNVGDDWNRIAQTSGNVKLVRSKLIADSKYDKVSQMADQFGDVPRPYALKSVDQAIKNVSEGVLPDQSLLSQLNTIKNNLTNKSFTYSQLRNARGEVGSLINDYFKGANQAIGERGVGSLQSIKSAMAQDLDSFASSHGDNLKTVWRNADNFYRNYLSPAKTISLAKALRTAKPDEIYSQFIKSGGVEGGKGSGNANILYNALDNKGRAAIRYGMINEAFERAYKGDLDEFSPAQFAGYLDRHAAAKGVFFNGTDKAEINGFKNLMRHVERSYQAIKKPDTGVRAIPYLVGGLGGVGLYTNPMATAGLAGATYGIKKLFTTDAGKRFLLSSSTLKPGSPKLETAVETLKRLFQQGAVNYQLQSEKPKPSLEPTPSSNNSQNIFMNIPD